LISFDFDLIGLII